MTVPHHTVRAWAKTMHTDVTPAPLSFFVPGIPKPQEVAR